MAARDETTSGDSNRSLTIAERCEAAGLPLTRPRKAILDVVLKLRTHPTADDVLAEASRKSPGIGRATVYRALEGFVRAGVIKKVAHPGSTVRYDGQIDQHHHMVCIRCNRIVDFTDRNLDSIRVPDTLKWDFVVSDVQVVLRGLCGDCIDSEEEEES